MNHHQARQQNTMHKLPLSAQKGTVLLFTLIALVAMTLAALALVRSIDTSNLVAGNVALKQAAIQEADIVMNDAFSRLDTGGLLAAEGTDRGINSIANNYYASLQTDTIKPFGMPDALETAPGTPNTTSGFTSRFVIERMCTVTGMWTEENCILSPFGKPVSDKDIFKLGLTPEQALYRISVKVSGPRNVVSYSQMIMNSGT